MKYYRFFNGIKFDLLFFTPTNLNQNLSISSSFQLTLKFQQNILEYIARFSVACIKENVIVIYSIYEKTNEEAVDQEKTQISLVLSEYLQLGLKSILLINHYYISTIS